MRIEYEASWCSHIPVLQQVLAASTGPVLELGAGLFSTPMLYWLCFDQGRELTSYDNNPDYTATLKKFNVNYIDDWDKVEVKPYSVVFIDQAPFERRHIDAARFANAADYVVIHDSQRHLNQYSKYDTIYHLFKYKTVYRKTKPHTTVLSNFHDFKFNS